ncbi:SusD/RagB family nutrient-binding outer membrane lipoprotein [Flavobacterium sp.]|uniref:SusD/RagB family nutrient-binding outer membrane lipoprotein n=1 Tax=Flavobacterium sp. TaxID=239 RepID=UPI0039E408A5
MKKIKYTLAALSLFVAMGCVSDDETFNENKDRSYEVTPETLIANAQRELSDQMTTPEVNLNPFRYFDQYWAATQYPTESRYNLTQRTVPDNLWNNLFRDVLGNLESAKGYVNAEAASDVKNNRLAIIEIMQVYTFQILVDTFGDIPYTDALQPTLVLPRYDDDADIYPKLITRLDAAIDNLNDAEDSFTSGDIVYGGDVASWRLFANSLKVKLGLNIADVNDGLARTTIESAVADGVILTNDQNAYFAYSGNAPFYNPIYAQLVASDRNDFVASKTIVDAMNTLSDPRRPIYFGFKPGTTDYVGGINGAANLYPNFSPMSDLIKSNNLPGVLFEATELNFYLAEAAERGYAVGGTAESYYNAAINASFEYWGIAGAAAGYLADPAVAYATAAGTWQEKIGKQAWIAFFNRPFEGWNNYRRLDVPTLIAPPNAVAAAEGKVPIRFTYPINEATVNEDNLQAAITAMGGNKLQTRVFWDVD